MKKIYAGNRVSCRKKLKQKILRVMKVMGFLLWAGMMGVYASTYSQSRLNINVHKGDLIILFHQIQQQSDYLIIYKDEIIRQQNDRILNLQMTDNTVQEVLDRAFAGTNLAYRISGRQIVVLENQKINRPDNVSRRQDTLLNIRGRVYDTHEPPSGLPGVSVRIKGTSTGVSTDMDGYFTIRAKKGDVLSFSMVSFQPYEYAVSKADKSLVISLKENVSALNEVVVTGLTEQKKRHIASSLSSLDVASNIEGKPVTSLSQSLQGGITGISVSQNSGMPGADAATILIRGVSTIGNSNPLVLVDGIPMDMNHIDPVTVESVTVLKDAAAAAIYGSRAANGVIVVTTKRGIPGKVLVNYDSYYGIQSPSSLPSTVDAATYMQMYNEAQMNAGNQPTYTDEVIQKTISGEDPLKYPNTNWVDLMINNAASITSHSLNVSGGNNMARFAVTGNYIYQQGVLPVNDMNRFNIRANTSISLSEKFQVNFDMLAIKRSTSQPNRINDGSNSGNRFLEDIYRVPPTILPRYPEKDGQVFYGQYVDIVNPLAYAEVGGSRKFESGQASINLQPRWEVFRNFNLKGQFSFRLNSDITRDSRESFNHFDYNTGVLLRTWGQQRNTTMSRTTYYYIGATADYTLDAGDHHLYAIGGYSQEETSSGAWQEYSLLSVYAKMNYSFRDKYLVEGTIRTDGSSRFASGHKFGYFPSVAVGWNLHNEAFMQSLSFVNNMKLRASYGQLGNENIGLYKYQTLISSASGIESTYGNPDISWETVNMLDIGLDMGLFRNKLGLTFDFYDKKTKGIILSPVLPSVGGFESDVPVNAGEVSNKGWELSLDYNQKINRDVNFSFRPGITYNRNSIISLLGGPYINTGATTPPTSPVINEVGHSIGSIYGYRSAGLLQAGDFADGTALVPVRTGERPGDIKYVDMNNDGVINELDQTNIGNPSPRLNYFANFRISYKKLDFEFLLQGVGQNDAVLLDMFALPLNMSRDGGVPTSYYAGNYWTPERTDARFPRISANPVSNNVTSDFWFQNGAYLRFKYIQLGYNFDTSLIKRMGLDFVRLYLNAQNPFTFTSVKITDPESRGTQWTYGIVKLYTLGISAKF